ncbi:hypothetical protein AYO47_04490 [Planctomyces sp. SCGC AG-212-M04]|nr:hypothetical protein AYO47_04490 [Planctomyces sp. SCGC AG-212-M04]
MTAEERARYIDQRVRLARISRALDDDPEDDEILREWQHTSKEVEALQKRFTKDIAGDPTIESEISRRSQK